jgi:hypothetical protein
MAICRVSAKFCTSAMVSQAGAVTSQGVSQLLMENP